MLLAKRHKSDAKCIICLLLFVVNFSGANINFLIYVSESCVSDVA